MRYGYYFLISQYQILVLLYDLLVMSLSVAQPCWRLLSGFCKKSTTTHCFLKSRFVEYYSTMLIRIVSAERDDQSCETLHWSSSEATLYLVVALLARLEPFASLKSDLAKSEKRV